MSKARDIAKDYQSGLTERQAVKLLCQEAPAAQKSDDEPEFDDSCVPLAGKVRHRRQPELIEEHRTGVGEVVTCALCRDKGLLGIDCAPGDIRGAMVGPAYVQLSKVRALPKYVHLNCALFSPEVRLEPPQKWKAASPEIRNMLWGFYHTTSSACHVYDHHTMGLHLKHVGPVIHRPKMKCCVCSKPGGFTGCALEQCNRAFHLKCALESGAQLLAGGMWLGNGEHMRALLCHKHALPELRASSRSSSHVEADEADLRQIVNVDNLSEDQFEVLQELLGLGTVEEDESEEDDTEESLEEADMNLSDDILPADESPGDLPSDVELAVVGLPRSSVDSRAKQRTSVEPANREPNVSSTDQQAEPKRQRIPKKAPAQKPHRASGNDADSSGSNGQQSSSKLNERFEIKASPKPLKKMRKLANKATEPTVEKHIDTPTTEAVASSGSSSDTITTSTTKSATPAAAVPPVPTVPPAAAPAAQRLATGIPLSMFPPVIDVETTNHKMRCGVEARYLPQQCPWPAVAVTQKVALLDESTKEFLSEQLENDTLCLAELYSPELQQMIESYKAHMDTKFMTNVEKTVMIVSMDTTVGRELSALLASRGLRIPRRLGIALVYTVCIYPGAPFIGHINPMQLATQQQHSLQFMNPMMRLPGLPPQPLHPNMQQPHYPAGIPQLPVQPGMPPGAQQPLSMASPPITISDPYQQPVQPQAGAASVAAQHQLGAMMQPPVDGVNDKTTQPSAVSHASSASGLPFHGNGRQSGRSQEHSDRDRPSYNDRPSSRERRYHRSRSNSRSRRSRRRSRSRSRSRSRLRSRSPARTRTRDRSRSRSQRSRSQHRRYNSLGRDDRDGYRRRTKSSKEHEIKGSVYMNTKKVNARKNARPPTPPSKPSGGDPLLNWAERKAPANSLV